MFAEMGASAESAGSLVNWKRLSRQAQKASRDSAQGWQSDEQTQKLIRFFQSNLITPIPGVPLTARDKTILMMTEASALVAPLLYLLLVFSTLGSVAWYFTQYFTSGERTDLVMMLVMIGVPALLCLYLLPLLIKPLFGGYETYQGRALSYHEAPALFELVNGISRVMGIPEPKRIELNNEVSLHMDATGGVNSALKKDLKLVIGVPLLAGMTVQQIAGLIAHEMGHFNQRNLVLAHFYITRGSRWLHYRAFAQDSWLKAIRFKLENGERSLFTVRFLAMTRFLILLIKRYFVMLYWLHGKMTASMSRRMELNADAYAANLIGSQAFSEMLKKLRCLQAVKQQVMNANQQAWKEGRLFSHLGYAIAAASKQVTPIDLKKIQSQMMAPQSQGCPSDMQRIQQTQALNSPGFFKANVSSAALLFDMKNAGRQLTLLDYDSMGFNDAKNHLVANEIIFAMKDHAAQYRKLADHFFNQRQHGRWLSLAKPESPADKQRDLQQTVDRIRERRVDDAKVQQQLELVQKKRQLLQLAQSFASAGVKASRHIKISGGLPSDVSLTLLQVEQQEKERLELLHEVDHLYFQRILLVTRCMSANDKLAVDLPLKNLLRLSKWMPQLVALEHKLQEFEELRQQVRLENNIAIRSLLQKQKQALGDGLLKLVAIIQKSQIQLNTDHGTCSLYQYVRDWSGDLPASGESLEVTELADKISNMLDAIRYQYDKWLGLVAVTCSRYEKALNIVPVNRVASQTL